MAPGFALILGKPGSVKITPANTERQDEHDDENQLAQCTSTGLHLRLVRGKADGAGRTQQDRPQREMPVRQRQEVQTLPRRLTGNQRCFKDSQEHRSRPPEHPSTWYTAVAAHRCCCCTGTPKRMLCGTSLRQCWQRITLLLRLT